MRMLGALSQETRLQIVRHLVGRGGEGAPAGEIAEALGVISSSASFHLAALERAGLISSERRSRKIIYRARTETLGALVSFILNDCCKGDPEVLACCATAPLPNNLPETLPETEAGHAPPSRRS
ncbi:MAG: metalloregulator ArsR/SmtB family transcription factor [Pseudomonadota bacterium]